jgi:hypothetical protein
MPSCWHPTDGAQKKGKKRIRSFKKKRTFGKKEEHNSSVSFDRKMLQKNSPFKTFLPRWIMHHYSFAGVALCM